MKTKIILAVVSIFAASGIFAQTLTKSIELKYKQTEGTNGCSVAYNPKTKLYYAVIAGNKSYPLEAFNVHGVNMHEALAGYDSRGLWYNKKTKSLQGISQGAGLCEIALDKSGYPGTVSTLSSSSLQPGNQSVGAYDSKKKKVVFYYDGVLHLYNISNLTQKQTLRLELTTDKDNINPTSVIYTGVKNKEFGLLDHKNKRVLVFNRKGQQTGSYQLPSSAIASSWFWFSYANGLVFLYDKETRTWTGYKGLN